jgi:hypothetical protein
MAPLLALLPAAAATTGTAAAATGATVAGGMAAGSVAALSAAAPVAAASTISAGTLLSAGMTGLSLLASGVEASSMNRAANDQANSMEANAKIMQGEAQAKNQATQEKTLQISRAERQTMGEQIAGYGASGVTGAGSPLEVMASTARNYERDIMMTGYGGSVAAAQDINQGNLYDWEAQQKRKTGKIAAGTTLLTGLGKLAYSKLGSQNYYLKV